MTHWADIVSPQNTTRKNNQQSAVVESTSCRVYIGHLAWEVDEAAVRNVLAHCGMITKIKWLTDRNTGEFRQAGFVSFAEPAGAAAALQAGADPGVMCLGRNMVVGPANDKLPAGAAPGNNRGGGGSALQYPPGMGMGVN